VAARLCSLLTHSVPDTVISRRKRIVASRDREVAAAAGEAAVVAPRSGACAERGRDTADGLMTSSRGKGAPVDVVTAAERNSAQSVATWRAGTRGPDAA